VRQRKPTSDGRRRHASRSAQPLHQQLADGRICSRQSGGNAFVEADHVRREDIAPDPADAQQLLDLDARREGGTLRREETNLRRESALGRPLGDLRAIEQQAAAIGCVGESLVADPALDHLLLYAERFGNLYVIQVHAAAVH
jgi:hypothetical protein